MTVKDCILTVTKNPLTTDEFKNLLEDPYRLTFRLKSGKLEYELHGCSEELFSEHSIIVEGTEAEGLIDAFYE